jgi:hypothetical protein
LFFVVNEYDPSMTLSEAITLMDFLRKRFRLLAEEGRCVFLFLNGSAGLLFQIIE